VPAVAALEQLRLDAPITLLAGDNGTGKSTLVEAVAEAMGFAPEGGELERAGELPAVRSRSARPTPARSSSSRRIRRSCSPARERGSTSSTATASRRAPTTTWRPSG
jgi:predicted ATPase